MHDLAPIYGAIRQNLRNHKKHVSRVVGAVCEQWFSSEAVAAINWFDKCVLPDDCCGMAESSKRDLIIRNERSQKVVATIESKVVHNNKNLFPFLGHLHAQVERNRRHDELPGCARGAVIYLIWVSYSTVRGRITQCDYLKVARDRIFELFPVAKYHHFPKKRFDEIIPVVPFSWPCDGDFHVSLHTHFVQRISR
jgi:hypothetical protein